MRQFAVRSLAVSLALALTPLPLQPVESLGADALPRFLDRVTRAEPRALHFDPQATLQLVASRMGVKLDPRIPTPAIQFESGTSLERFQDATEQQWGFRPKRFVNAFIENTNEIYLIDDPAHYAGAERTIDDALAHELVHYVQARYGRANLSDWAECEAVEIQKWFRAVYLHSPPGLISSAPD